MPENKINVGDKIEVKNNQGNTSINEPPSNQRVRWMVFGVVAVVLVLALAYGYNSFGLKFFELEGQSTPAQVKPADESGQ